MSLLRLLAIAFLLIAAFPLAMDLWSFASTGGWEPKALGTLWFELDAGSLNALQAGLERHVWPPLWDPGMTTVLLWPAWAVPMAIAALLLLIKQIFYAR